MVNVIPLYYIFLWGVILGVAFKNVVCSLPVNYPSIWFGKRILDLINSFCSPTTALAEKIYTGSTLYNMRIQSQS